MILPLFLPRLQFHSFIPDSSTFLPTPTSARRIRNRSCPQFITVPVCLSSSHFYPVLAWGPSHRPSWPAPVWIFPTATAFHELLQCVSFPQGTVLQEGITPKAHSSYQIRSMLQHGHSMGSFGVGPPAPVWSLPWAAVWLSVLIWSFSSCRFYLLHHSPVHAWAVGNSLL